MNDETDSAGVHARAAHRRLRALAALGPGPFTAKQALRSGLTRDDLRSRDVRKLTRGVFASATTPPSLPLLSRGVLLTAPREARMAAFSAAMLQRFPVPHTERLYVSVPRGNRWRCADAIVLSHDDPYEVVLETSCGPVSATPGAGLLGELVDRVPFVEAVVLADAVLARSGEMAPAVQADWAGHPHLARVASFADGRAESPMETRLRMLLRLAGFPAPEVQHVVSLDARGRRFDLAYPEVKVAVEYDGGHHFSSERARHDDAVRREAATRAGWLIVGVVSYGIHRDPAETVARVVTALSSRGVRVVPCDDWRRYFPQRL